MSTENLLEDSLVFLLKCLASETFPMNIYIMANEERR